MPSILSSAATKCISDVPGFAKHTSTPLASSVRTSVSAPFMMVAATLLRSAVEMRDRNLLELDALEAAHIDRRDAIALRIDPFRIRLHAAVRTEPVLDHVLVEFVR